MDADTFAELVAAKLAEKQRETPTPAASPGASEKTIGEVVDLIHSKLLKNWRRSPGYRNNVVRGLAKCLEAVGHKRICDLLPEDAMDVWSALPETALHSQGGGLKSYLRKAAKMWRIAGLEAFVDLFPQAPQSRQREIHIDDDSQREVMKALRWGRTHTTVPDDMLDLLEVEFLAPFRAGELAAALVEHVHLRERFVLVPVSKDGKPRRVPLPKRAVQILAAHIQRLPIPIDPRASRWLWPNKRSRKLGHIRPDTAGKAWAKVRDGYCAKHNSPAAAAIRKYWLHSFRAVISTQSQAHGASPKGAMKAMGHSSEKTNNRYTFIQDADAHLAVDISAEIATSPKPRNRSRQSKVTRIGRRFG